MKKTVSLQAKKDLIRWFLSSFPLKKKEVSWLFNYLLSTDEVLERVHFTFSYPAKGKSMLVSSVQSPNVAFEFRKGSQIYVDVERAFHDIRIHRDEDVYISLDYPGRYSCPHYQSVVEGEDPSLDSFSLMNLMAEIIWDNALRKHRMDRLEIEIDDALLHQDKARFLHLTEEWKELQAWEQKTSS